MSHINDIQEYIRDYIVSKEQYKNLTSEECKFRGKSKWEMAFFSDVALFLPRQKEYMLDDGHKIMNYLRDFYGSSRISNVFCSRKEVQEKFSIDIFSSNIKELDRLHTGYKEYTHPYEQYIYKGMNGINIVCQKINPDGRLVDVEINANTYAQKVCKLRWELRVPNIVIKDNVFEVEMTTNLDRKFEIYTEFQNSFGEKTWNCQTSRNVSSYSKWHHDFFSSGTTGIIWVSYRGRIIWRCIFRLVYSSLPWKTSMFDKAYIILDRPYFFGQAWDDYIEVGRSIVKKLDELWYNVSFAWEFVHWGKNNNANSRAAYCPVWYATEKLHTKLRSPAKTMASCVFGYYNDSYVENYSDRHFTYKVDYINENSWYIFRKKWDTVDKGQEITPELYNIVGIEPRPLTLPKLVKAEWWYVSYKDFVKYIVRINGRDAAFGWCNEYWYSLFSNWGTTYRTNINDVYNRIRKWHNRIDEVRSWLVYDTVPDNWEQELTENIYEVPQQIQVREWEVTNNVVEYRDMLERLRTWQNISAQWTTGATGIPTPTAPQHFDIPRPSIIPNINIEV